MNLSERAIGPVVCLQEWVWDTNSYCWHCEWVARIHISWLLTPNGLTLKHGAIYNVECYRMPRHENVGKTSSGATCHDRTKRFPVDAELYARKIDSTWNTACALWLCPFLSTAAMTTECSYSLYLAWDNYFPLFKLRNIANICTAQSEKQEF